MSVLLLPNEILSLPAQAARKLVQADAGDAALLYLALLDCGGEIEGARRRLRWPEPRLEEAYRRLAQLELVQSSTPLPPPAAPPREERAPLPKYSRDDVADALEKEPEFQGLYQEVERMLGATLTDRDLQGLYTIYDYLGLSPEVVLLLTSFTLHREHRLHPGRRVRMTQISQEAFRWKRLGVDNPQAAQQYLEQQQRVDHREWGMLAAVGVTERRPAVEKEREYLEQWAEMNLSDELISLAYQRTVYQKGARNWPYMNKILKNWHQAGFTTPQQVQEGDRPARQGQVSAPQRGSGAQSTQPTSERIQQNNDWLDRFLEEQSKEG